MSTVLQLSVLVENTNGRLSEVLSVLRDNDIDIRASTITDTTTFGILRMIVDRCQEAEGILRQAGFTVTCAEVNAISVEDRPGGLLDALLCLENNNIGVEYMYAAAGSANEKAFIILRTTDGVDVSDLLAQNGIRVVQPDEIFRQPI